MASTQSVGNTGRYLNDGWKVQGGAGYTSHLTSAFFSCLGYNSLRVQWGTGKQPGFSVATFFLRLQSFTSLVGPGSVIRSEQSSAPTGMGVALGSKWHGKIFAEARNVHIFMNNNMRAAYIQVTFGFRW